MFSLEGKTVCVVDAYGLIFQTFFAPGMEMSNAQGEPTGAVFGFARDVLSLIDKLRPDYLVCAFDMRAPTFRKEFYPEYKANRSAAPDDLILQFDYTREFLKGLGVPALGVDGFEADDVLATVAKAVRELGGTTILTTSDKDARQLLDDSTSIYLIRKDKFYRAADLEADWGIRPDQVVDFQALVGDKADNVPGAPLIGPKTATELLQKFGTLERILQAAVGMKGKRYENLRAGRELIAISRRLVTLRDDVPLTLDWDAAKLGGIDPDRLRKLFQYWGFRSLLGKIDPLAARLGTAPAPESELFARMEARLAGSVPTRPTQAPTPLPTTLPTSPLLVEPSNAESVSAVETAERPTAARIADGAVEFPADLPLPARLAVSQYGCVPKPLDAAPTPAPGTLEPTETPPTFDFELVGTERLPNLAALPLPETDPAAIANADFETIVVDDSAKLEKLVERLRAARVVSVAAITREEPEIGRVRAPYATLVGLALAVDPNQAFYAPVLAPLGTPVLPLETLFDAVRPALESPTLPKIGSEIKFDALVLERRGLRLRGVAFDVALADYLVRSGETRRSLADVAETCLGRRTFDLQAETGTGKKRIALDLLPPETVAKFAADAVLIPLSAAPILRARIAAEPALERLALDLETPLIETLAEMERVGIAIEADRFRAASAEFAKRRELLEREIRTEIAVAEPGSDAAQTINLNSPKQLQRILFDVLKLPVLKKTKTGPSVDAEVLDELALYHPIPEKIVELRRLTKLRGTYLEPLPTLVRADSGRVCATFNQAATATGRLSSSDPNLQNIPTRTDDGKAIRAGFVPDRNAGFDALLSCDYSQIELRVLAHFCGDAELRRAFADGEDIHARVASRIFNVAPDAVTPEMRRKAKAVNFGLVYGQTAFGLSKAIAVSTGEAAAYIDSFFATYPGVLDFFDRVLDDCARRGYVQTLLGRRRALAGVRGARGRKTLNFPERAAINAVVQGTAADLTKMAMLAVWRRLKREGWAKSNWAPTPVAASSARETPAPQTPTPERARLLLQIHDELLFETRRVDADELARIVVEEMSLGNPLTVPLKVDAEIGDNWGEI